MSKNHLANEKSPYLLQHADNPVDWRPWGAEAFARAVEEDKPVFLSIGYSTCHWCHVMEHESFEDEEVAALLNDNFVCVKVDREERPDIDQIYMEVCQMATGGGGWPLTIIMTPDKKPFFAATYIPKNARFGRAGMVDLIPQLNDFWKNRRDEVITVAERLTVALKQSAVEAAGEALGEVELAQAYEQMQSRYDELNGGFGSAPKFPTPHNLLFLLRSWKRTGASKALEMVETTLRKMRQGGIYDHLGHGFHRYSTDDRWLVPHFEKMLYDQALLAMAYIETYQATGDSFYRQTAEEIFEYVLRDMTDPGGGFYSAEDADSEGEEGKFYVWKTYEIRELLSGEDADLFIKLYGLKDDGNFIEEATGTKTGENILHLAHPQPVLAREAGVSEGELAARLSEMRETLFRHREDRMRPYKDDKILTDWNGLMISALARASQVFNKPRYAEQAARASEFILRHRASDGRLLHRYRDGDAAISANLDDYAFFIMGLIDLYEATFELKHLETALELTSQQQRHFTDNVNGGFFFTPDDGEELLVRNKEVYDAAVPSGNSAAMFNLIRLARLTARPDLEEAAAGVGKAFQQRVSRVPLAHSFLLCAVDFMVGPSVEIVVVSDPDSPDTQAYLDVIQEGFLPNKVVLLRSPDPSGNGLFNLAPYTEALTPQDTKPTVYICKNYSCEMPVNSVDAVKDLLGIGR